MKRAVYALVLCLAPFGSIVPSAAHAAEKPNILVMGEDADEHSAGTQTVVVARDTRVFKQVLEAISEEMAQEGFGVFDERAVTLDNFKQTRAGRTEAELMDIARSVQRPPIDAVALFTIYAGARRLAYTTEVYTRIAGRILNVRTGQQLGGFEVTSPNGWRAPASCDRDCLLEVIGKNAKSMAGDLGAVLAQKLSATLPVGQNVAHSESAANKTPAAYTLVFAGFTPDEITDVEEYLVAFKGYKLHRPVTTSPRSAQYWYEIDSDSARLNRNLRMMLDRIGTEGRITFSGIDNTFSVEKVVPGKAH